MGKGDKKTKRGKIIQGSYGVSRLRKSNKVVSKLPADNVVKVKAVKEVVVEDEAKEVKKTTARKTTKKTEEPTAEA
ncbi:MAG: 30S ribosomal protein THX [Bacteroidota bacterium]